MLTRNRKKENAEGLQRLEIEIVITERNSVRGEEREKEVN